MAKSSRRQKVMKQKAERRARKAESFKRREADGPNPNSNYGKRQLARQRGEPAKQRPFPPWWHTNPLIVNADQYAVRLSTK
jgi:hypothetical protein